MYVNTIRTASILAIAAAALSACGSQKAPNNDQSAADSVCSGLIDGTKFTAVESARSVGGAAVKGWLMAREHGNYIPEEVAAIKDRDALTVCQMSAPGLQYPHPAPIPGSGATAAADADEPTSAIVIVGATTEPNVDSIGPDSRVSDLMKQLP